MPGVSLIMKTSVVIVGVALMLGLLYLASRIEGGARTAQQEQEPELHLRVVPHGRVLFVVVDQDGVYLGPERLTVEQGVLTINAFLREHEIRNLVVYGTDLARYGEAVRLFAGIDQKLLRWSQLATRPLPIGSRKPLTGNYRPRCCFAVDTENTEDQPDWR